MSGVKIVTYISMLRGINVGGQRKIKMEDLISLYESLGFKYVKTYVQSGNVIFASPQEDPRELSKSIEAKIKQGFNFDVAVLLRTMAELHRIINDNPFLEEKGMETDKLYLTFLSGAPTGLGVGKVNEKNGGSDKFIVSNREIYLYLPHFYAKTKFSNDFFERKLCVAATTRNWKTVNALLDIAKKYKNGGRT